MFCFVFVLFFFFCFCCLHQILFNFLLVLVESYCKSTIVFVLLSILALAALYLFTPTSSFSFFPISLIVNGSWSSWMHHCCPFSFVGFHFMESYVWMHSPAISYSSLSHSRLAAPEVVASSGRTTVLWKVNALIVWLNEMKTYMLEYNRLHLKLSRSCFCRIIRFCNSTSYCDFFIMDLMYSHIYP